MCSKLSYFYVFAPFYYKLVQSGCNFCLSAINVVSCVFLPRIKLVDDCFCPTWLFNSLERGIAMVRVSDLGCHSEIANARQNKLPKYADQVQFYVLSAYHNSYSRIHSIRRKDLFQLPYT